MHQRTPARPLRVGMISLCCAKNLVDCEIMLGSLLKEGLQITNDAASADVVIVNTCSFIDAAQEESVDTILESAELRNPPHVDDAPRLLLPALHVRVEVGAPGHVRARSPSSHARRDGLSNRGRE